MVARPRATVHVVRLQRLARHLLEQVDVLVGGARAGERGQRLAAVGVAQLGEAARHQAERLVPGGGLEPARGGVAHERRGQAVRRLHEVEAGRAPLHAQKALVGRARRPFGVHNVAVLHHQVELAAHPAVRAGGAHALHAGRAVAAAALHRQRAGRARLGAVAARLAARRAPVRAERRPDGGARAPLAGRERVVARGHVARAHAPLARDAAVRVVREEGMAVEDGLFPRRTCARACDHDPRRTRLRIPYHAVGAGERLQLAGAIGVAVGAAALGAGHARSAQQLQRHAAVVREAQRLRGHRHALARDGGARRHGMFLALHVHHAHATRPDGAHVLQVAQRGNTDPRRPRGLQDGRAFGNGDARAVYRQARHAAPCLPPSRRSRTGRTAGNVRTPV